MRAVCRDFAAELVEEFPELARHHWRAKRLWSGPYLVRKSAIPRWTCSAPTSSSRTGLATRFTRLEAGTSARSR
jgi:hypothetical protein